MANPKKEASQLADINDKPMIGAQQAKVADPSNTGYTITWTTGEPTAGTSATIADGGTPTVAELGQAVADITAILNTALTAYDAKFAAIIDVLEAHGLSADA